MTWRFVGLMTLMCISLVGCEKTADSELSEGPLFKQVRITTTLGAFTLDLDSSAAPLSVANFSRYVDEGYYDGGDGLPKTTFHRVISGFMVQGGGIRTDGKKKLVSHAPIVHEGANGLMNQRGTIAMARTNDPDSATSQFFVNHVDNDALDFVNSAQPGYVVFGRVSEGMETIDAIAASETDAQDVPLVPVVIEKVEVIEID